jgi:hypothetical protein
MTAEELRVATEVERLLAIVVPVAPPAHLNDAVMRAIHARTNPRGWRRALAACAQIIAEPLVPVSLALAIVMIPMLAMVHRVMPVLGAMTIARATVIAPLVLWISWQAFSLTRAVAARER